MRQSSLAYFRKFGCCAGYCILEWLNFRFKRLKNKQMKNWYLSLTKTIIIKKMFDLNDSCTSVPYCSLGGLVVVGLFGYLK